MLIYDAVEIKLTAIISLLEWHSCLSDLPFHGEQIEPSAVFVGQINHEFYACMVFLYIYSAC